MKHLKPLTKAEMTWYEPTILDYIYQAVSFIITILPVLSSLAGSKESGTEEER